MTEELKQDDPWRSVHAKLDQIIADVNTPPRPGHPGGLLTRMAKGEERLDALEADQAENTNRHLTLKHGAALATVSALLSACATKVADAFTRGVSPPGHP